MLNKIRLLLLTLAVVVLSCATTSTIVTPLSYVGTNLDGGQFGTKYPGVEGTDYSWPTTADVDYLMSKNMNSFRIGFQWERLQPTPSSAFAPAYFAKLDGLVKYTTGKGANVFLNPHNFARYKLNGIEFIVGSPEVPNAAFADLWTKLAAHYKGNPRVMFSLVNEPHDMPTRQWVRAANEAIKGIRSTGNTNVVSIPGNAWTSAAFWSSSWSPQYDVSNAVAMLEIVDSANNHVFEVHNYFDPDGSGTYSADCANGTVGSTKLANVTAWARANKKKILVGEFGTTKTANCQASVKDMLTYVHNNSDVYAGWLWWSAGTPWGNTYQLSIMPKAGVEDVRMSWLTPFMPNASSPPPVDAAIPPPVDAAPPVVSPTKPAAPIAFTPDTVFTTTSFSPAITNWAFVPKTYDSTHNTPMRLFVWLHGCGGQSEWDAHMVSFMPNQNWISLAPGGREKACWSGGVVTDGPKVLAAIADLRTHFNIDPSRIILGGYSSGGDIGYPLLFRNAKMFAGGLFENTGPSTGAMSDSTTAGWKVNIMHLHHTGDTVYPIATIRTKMATLKTAGFPVTLIEKAGTHYDNDNGAFGTTYDLRTFLLPQISGAWVTPDGTVTPPAACSYTYSVWGSCQSSNTQTRTVTGSTPTPCTPSSQVLSQACTYTPPLCTYAYSPWGACSASGLQTRTATSIPDPCTPNGPILTQTCTYIPPPVDSGPIDAGPIDSGTTIAPFYARRVVYNQGTTWTCMYFYVKNTTDASRAWSLMYVNAKDSKLTAFWSMKTNQTLGSTGSVKFTPVDVTWINAKTETKVGGACFDFGPLKQVPTVSGIN